MTSTSNLPVILNNGLHPSEEMAKYDIKYLYTSIVLAIIQGKFNH